MDLCRVEEAEGEGWRGSKQREGWRGSKQRDMDSHAAQAHALG